MTTVRLNEIMEEPIDQKYTPSLCTASLPPGNRTGEHFMEFSVPGLCIKRFCTPECH
ncbi:MAG: hypothetical protein M0C28_41300 [Candidatus Moduliflexus flocculans]|nr:hypothetical protein [Candidatus Moduliflexus flocculans]